MSSDPIVPNSFYKHLELEFEKCFKPFLVSLGTAVIYVSFAKDVSQMGFRWDWLLIRVFYLPTMLAASWVFERVKGTKFHWLPLWVSATYITVFVGYFSSFTNFFQSSYVNGLIQLYTVMAIMPIPSNIYYLTSFLSVLVFCTEEFILGQASAIPTSSTVSNLIPLLICPPIVHSIAQKLRTYAYDLNIKLRSEICSRSNVIQIQSRRIAEAEVAESLTEIARQVAHDLGSPLSVLNIFVGDLPDTVSHHKRMLNDATARIHGISQELLDRTRGMQEKRSLESLHVGSLVLYAVKEKQLTLEQQCKIKIELNISPKAYSLFSSGDKNAFLRAISNLLNNACEAIQDKGEIQVKLTSIDDLISINLKDTGCGIPEEVMSKIFSRGFSYGKAAGNGLGLSQVREVIESMGGKIEIFSQVASGTTIQIILPTIPTPNWFATHIEVKKEIGVVAIDDDLLIHKHWQRRLDRENQIPLITTLNPNELTAPIGATFVVDYSFGSSISSNGIVEMEGLAGIGKPYLVSDYCFDPSVIEKLTVLGFEAVPKGMIPYVPITIYE